MTSVKDHSLNGPPVKYLECQGGASLGASEVTVGKKRKFISCDAQPHLQTGICLSLEVPTCCLEAIKMLHSFCSSVIPLLPTGNRAFPSPSQPRCLYPCPSLATSPGAEGSPLLSVEDSCKDIFICLIHPFLLLLRGSKSFLSTTIFENTPSTTCLWEQSKYGQSICASIPLGFCHFPYKIPSQISQKSATRERL